MSAQSDARDARIAERVAAIVLQSMQAPVQPPVEVAKPKTKRKSRSVRISEANAVIRPERAKSGKLCPCGRSMSKARTASINGVVRCHYCFSHR